MLLFKVVHLFSTQCNFGRFWKWWLVYLTKLKNLLIKEQYDLQSNYAAVHSGRIESFLDVFCNSIPGCVSQVCDNFCPVIMQQAQSWR